MHENEIIARKYLPQLLKEQIALNDERVGMLENQKEASESEFEQKGASALQTLQLDSSDYRHNLELFNAGYISGDQLQSSLLKVQKDNTYLLHLLSARSLALERFAHDIHKLGLENKQLEARAASAELQSQIRSPVRGLLIDIRRVQHDNKIQLTFIIRRSA